MDKRTKHKDLLLNGKWITGEPAAIGMNFRTLKNLRHTDTHVKGIAGMTKINTAVMDATYLKTRSAYHLNKSQPQESHVLVQAENSGETASHVLQNKTAIPSAGAFEATDLWTDTSGAGLGRFSDAPDGQLIYANGVDTCIWGGDEIKVGALITTKTALSAATDAPVDPVDYTEQINNTKHDAQNLFTCGGSYKSFLVGSPRPVSGITVYVDSVNTTANTLTIKESTTGAWNALTALTDTTQEETGKVFSAVKGAVTWASTVATTKPRYIEGYYLYWYQFTIDDGTADIYQITLDCPFQGIIDMWDGIYRDIARFYVTTTTQAEKSVNVYREDYDSASTYTYADISSLVATTQYVEIGFTEKQTAVYLTMPPGYVNTSASVASVDYWDGDSYATVGDIVDGTATSGVSLAKSGAISWVNASVASEQKKQYANAIPMYYYRIKWSVALSSSVRLDYVAGITASNPISHYKFPIFAQGRVLLCCDMAGDKNKALVSSRYLPQVYNGGDSVDIYFGEEGELTCGTSLFSQFGSSLYSLILMFKDTETWIVAGQEISQWENNISLISSSIGCPAPQTLKTVNLSVDPTTNLNRGLAIWQGANGVYMSDGRAPIPIHHDIREFFDPKDSRCILKSKIGDSVGFVDPINQEYHLLVASGSAATTLNTELVYDISRNKWFEIDRGSDLQCGLTVIDTDGNFYTYGFLDTGYMEYLENGTDFDGTDITHTVQFGDIALDGSAVETRVSDLTLIAVAKAVTSNDVTLTHYADSKSTGTDITLSPARSGYRLAQPDNVNKLDASPFHSFKMVMVTNDETIGFEPLSLVVTYHDTSENS